MTIDPLLAKLQATAESKEAPVQPEWDPDLIPDIEEDDHESSNPELDAFMEGIDILDAYTKWCGKMEPKVGSKREGIMVSCPNPLHPDANPSAWINLDKQTWYCGGCALGGDKYDIAAWHFGYDVPGYKEKETFPGLVERMAEDFGYVVRTTPTGQQYLDRMSSEPEAPVVAEEGGTPSSVTTAPSEDDTPSNVVAFPGSEDVLAAADSRLMIDWETLVPEQTFLHDWMHSVTIDDLPHEFYFWLGLVAIGAACSTDVTLRDFIPVKGNLFVCLYGNTSTGKTRSLRPLFTLLRDALPYDPGDDFDAPHGVQITPTPASAEALVDIFQHKIHDPSNMEIIDYAQVNGLLNIDELSEFVARASRVGSSMKEIAMQLYDGHGDVTHKSLTGGLRVARDHFCQMVTTTQPRATQEFLTKSDEFSGFLNRWIVAYGIRRCEPIAYGGMAPDLTLPTNDLKRIREWASKGHGMELDGDSLRRWEEFFKDVMAPLKEQGVPIMGRLDLTMKKLMLLFAANEICEHPQVRHVDMAISMFGYLTAVMNLFSSNVRATDYDHCWREVEGIIVRHTAKKSEPPTRRQINNSIKDKFAANLVTQVLIDMTRAEVVIEDVHKPTKGPSSVRYKYVGIA